jgi:hypothetical protein
VPGGSRYPAAATRPAFRAHRAGLAGRPVLDDGRADRRQTAAKSAQKLVLRGNPARAWLAFQAMQKNYYLLGSGLYKGEPFSYLWPFSQAMAATVSMANIPHLGVSMARELKARDRRPALLPRHEQLRCAGRHLHEHAGGLRRHRRAPGGAGRARSTTTTTTGSGSSWCGCTS